MSERLVLLVDGAGAPIELPRAGVFTIGSARERVDLCLAGPGVGAVHCVIGRSKGGGFALKDLGTPGGTLVNGAPIQQRRLEAGDEIAIGARRLAIVDPGRRASPPAVHQPGPEALPAPLPVLRGYRIEKRLGRGGMGSVYLAVQASLARRVALKVLDPALSADKDFVARFQAEARAAAALSHPHVVTVYDVWEEQEHHWLSMEYMERGNLEERVLRNGPLAPSEVLGILIEAARGLEYAERRKIVHRDIKPANLMQDASGLTKIADLGLATETAADLGEASGARIFGTPHFISPEQARGEPVDGRSDLYSLGATAYRLLTARTPFEGATRREILRARFTETPRPPRELAPEVPAALEAVVLRLLAREPAARYPGAGALLAELERLRGAELASAGHAPRRWPLWLAGAVLSAAGVALVLWLPGMQRPEASGSAAGTSAAAPAASPETGAGALLAAEAAPPISSEAPAEAELDSDSALKALEREAERAYAEIPPNLAPDERRAALAELAAGYTGTTAARRFEEELAALAAAPATAATPEAQPDPLGSTRAALAAAGDLERPLHAALEAFAAMPPDPVQAQDTHYVAAREEAIRGLLAARAGRAEAELVLLHSQATQGRFDEVAARLAELVAWLAPSGPAELPAPEFAAPELARLAALCATAAARADGLAAEREAYFRSLERHDARALGALLSGDGPVARALARLDLRAAEAALGGLEVQKLGGATFAFANDLRGELGAGSAALDALVAAFDAGQWRRRSLLDPRPPGRGSLTVVALDSGGLAVGEQGAGERIGWESFAANPAALDQLFHQRLAREYTAEEQRGIAFLMRLAAVERAAAEARKVFDGDEAALGEDQLASLLAGFEVARPWCAEAAAGAALAAELGAARVLVDSLEAAGAGSWALAATRAEWLLADHGTTLLVRRLSDGSLLATASAAPVTAPAAAPTEPASAPPDAGVLGGGQ